MEVSESRSTVIARSLLHKLSGIKKLLRIIEIFLILLFITWAFSRIPLLVRVSTDYFAMLVNVVLSPLFIFLLSNVIGLSLFFFFNSEKFHGDYSSEAHMEFYSEIICNSEDYYHCKLLDDEVTTTLVEGCNAVVYQDKQTIVEVVKKKEKKETTGLGVEDDRKRSQAAEDDGADVEEDQMSDEEFQRAIEAFIAKQVKFHKEEKLAVVPLGSNVINALSKN